MKLTADESSIAQEIDSLKQTSHDQDEEIKQLTGRVAAKEAEKDLEDGASVELSDLKVELEEMKDRRAKAEGELKTLQSIMTDMVDYEEVVSNLKCPDNITVRAAI